MHTDQIQKGKHHLQIQNFQSSDLSIRRNGVVNDLELLQKNFPPLVLSPDHLSVNLAALSLWLLMKHHLQLKERCFTCKKIRAHDYILVQ